jgi:two-component system sensor histidine kinase HydH
LRRSTSRKLSFYSVLASILLLASGLLAAWYVRVLQGQNAWAIADNVPSIRAAPKLELAIREMRHALDQFEISSDRAYLAHAVQLQTEVEQARADVEKYASTKIEYGLVAQINEGLKKFFSQLRELSTRPATDDIRAAVRDLDQNILAQAVLPYTKKYLDFNAMELSDRSRQNETMASRLVIALVLFGICGAAAGVSAGYGLAQGIRRNIYQLSIPLRDVAGRLNRVVGPVVIDEHPGMEDLEAGIKKIAAEVTSIIEKFHATHRQVIRADQLAALGQLAAGLAHEMHNPLMCMKILVQSACAEGTAALDSSDLRVLDEELTRVQNLLQSFLNFARPAKLERREVDLRNIVSQTTTVLAARAARRHISIEYRPPQRPVILRADETQLRQIALNLLLNALDAVADEGTVWVEIVPGSRLPPESPLGSEPIRGAFLCVADNGRGLPAKDRERIFEPFFSTKETGLGLGLAICQRIVESHGGTIEVSERPGGGTVFNVFLPVSAPDDASEPPAPANVPPLDAPPAIAQLEGVADA